MSWLIQELHRMLWQKSPKQELLETLQNARDYQEWEHAAKQLDEFYDDNLIWRQQLPSRDYDYKLIHARCEQTIKAREEQDINVLINVLRSGLVRNLGNITSPKLYNRAYAGTKTLIDEYVSLTAESIREISLYPTTHSGIETGLSNQEKMNLFHDSRQAFGRTCLVLQGGSIFGLCHIGVVKALHLHGLLPRVIAGTATGALMAALVCTHREDELAHCLSGDQFDLSAFAAASEQTLDTTYTDDGHHATRGWFATLLSRARRFVKYGYVLDVDVLSKVVRANVGDMTFQEAYIRTKRILNITISTPSGGVPGLLNYLTAPNVLIWSAAMASNAIDACHSPVPLQCKTPNGEIIPWEIPAHTFVRPPKSVYNRTPSTDHDRDTPLSRVAELFNVNHFIVSQARPYLAPFLAPSLYHSSSARTSKVPWSASIMNLVILELQHRLTQMDMLGWLSPGVRRLLLDENVPGSSWTLVPQVSLSDFTHLLRNPTAEEIDYWILRGQRSVWPAESAIKVRCIVEIELDRAYQVNRARKPFDATPDLEIATSPKLQRERQKHSNSAIRQRAASVDAG
ncbi:hypothetical protein M433DRAFT_141562 [Acidomyces richmondensis BFW]|nr:hypothetical protein M433DRAFT_141562 [Acidomyces richmondensis BFW]